MEEVGSDADTNDLARNSRVFIPEEEYERAREILWGESEVERDRF